MKERLEIEKMKIEMAKEESNTKFQSKSEHFNFDAAKNIHLKTHLDDNTVETLQDAAVISDNYTLSHKKNFKGQNFNTSIGNYKNQSTERTDSKPVAQNKSQSSYNMSSPKFETFEKKSLTCAYCKKNGHLMANCLRLKKKNERDNKPKTSACTTPRVTNTLECPASQAFKSSFCDYMEDYKPFMSDGFVSIVDNTTLQPIKILRDTGVSQSLLLEGVLPLSEENSVGASVLFQGNDLARNKVVSEQIVTSEPVVDVKSPEDDAELYPACVVTRAMARKQQNEDLQEDQFDYIDLSDIFLADIECPGSAEKAVIRPPSISKNLIMPWPDVNSHSLDQRKFVEEQNKDPEVLQLSKRAQPQEKADKVAECYYHQDGILMRKWRPPDAIPEEEWRVVYQVVVPNVYRQDIIGLALDTPLAGHLDVPNKTTAVCHDVDVGDASPIKQHPYRLNPLKLEFMRQEIKYMLDNDIIEPSNSEWSSPCLLVPKIDKTFRFVTHFRKVNSVLKSDSYPIPRIDDCIDNIGKAKFESPVLITPDFEKQFKLAVDANDVGIGAVLYQETDDNVEKPMSYFSKK
ncbi:unnamed protein product [Mytilus coruscus]|uniref:Reverse transcriptase/retrotransposon-derived protein RNase H-like domain-containing protein n=1 Tax=Mytilus coruscus TaxID=42192 RepID=A0A6J8AZV7_MYTCO|nr:unnamed protein product [Mytilus coruscus]